MVYFLGLLVSCLLVGCFAWQKGYEKGIKEGAKEGYNKGFSEAVYAHTRNALAKKSSLKNLVEKTGKNDYWIG